MEGAILKSAMGTRSLVNNAPIVLKPAMRISIRALFLLRRYWTGPIIRLMPTHKMFISGLIVAMLLITRVQAEEAPASTAASTDPIRHTAGGLDSAGRLLLQLEADAELISLTLENTAFFLIARPAVAPVPVGNLLIVPDKIGRAHV